MEMRYQIRYLFILLTILLSGCATHNPFNPSSHPSLKQLTPHYVGIQNGYLEYYRFGKGSPIVLIEGYLTDVSSWNKDFLTTLATKHQLIVFNNRCVGCSYVRSNRYESQDLARDTYQLIQRLHLKKPAVLGISMGGMIAQKLAVLYPNKLGSLILINTAIAGEQSIRPHPAIAKEMLNMPMNKLGRYFLALKLLFPAFERGRMAWILIFDRFQPGRYAEINPYAVVTQQKFLLLQWTKDNETARQLANLTLPVLILNGTADEVIPPCNSDVLKKIIPQAQLKSFQNGGHAMIYQWPSSIANTINEFIDHVEKNAL